MNEQIYCGIDIAKRHFVVGLSGRKQTKTFTHNPKGIQQAVEYLQKSANVDLIVLESTGGLDIPLAKALYRADFRVVIANPHQTHLCFPSLNPWRKPMPKRPKCWHHTLKCWSCMAAYASNT